MFIMVSEKTDWLQLATDAHSDSTSFIEENFTSQWEDNLRMFQNKHIKKSKYNNKLYDKRSKIFRPKTRSAAMKFEAAVSTAYFSTNDLIDVSVEDINNDTQYIAAGLAKSDLQYHLSKNIPWFQLAIAAAQEAWKLGNCVSYQGWVYEEDKDGVIKKDHPSVRLIPINNFRVAPTASSFDPIGTSPYLIEMIPMYIDEIMDRMGEEDGKTGEPKWKIYSKEELLGYLNRKHDPVDSQRQGEVGNAPQDDAATITEFDIIWVHRNIIRKENQDYLYYTLGTEAMLSDPKPLEQVDKIGRAYVMGSLLLEAFRLIKMGMPELGQGLQEETNALANDRIDNIHYILHKRWIGKRGRNTDYSSLLRNIPGGVTLTENPAEDLIPVQVNDVTSSAYIEQDRLNVDYDELIGNFSAGSVQTNRSLNETVGGLNLISSGAGQITEYHIRNFNETWVEPVLRQLLKLIGFYETDERILSFVHPDEREGLFETFGIQEGLNVIFRQDINLTVNVGVSSTNPQFKAEKFMFAMNSVGQLMASPAMSIMELKEVVKEVFGILGYKNGMRFFSIMKEEDPRITMLTQQVQELQAIIDQEKIKEEAKMMIEQAKLKIEEKKLQLEEIKVKAEAYKDESMGAENMANAQKLQAEAQEIAVGIKQDIEKERLVIERAKLQLEATKAQMSDRTKRDEIMANWQKQRETDDAKLKITLANQAMNMRANMMGEEDNDEDDVEPRFMGGQVAGRQQYLVGEAGPELAVATGGQPQQPAQPMQPRNPMMPTKNIVGEQSYVEPRFWGGPISALVPIVSGIVNKTIGTMQENQAAQEKEWYDAAYAGYNPASQSGWQPTNEQAPAPAPAPTSGSSGSTVQQPVWTGGGLQPGDTAGMDTGSTSWSNYASVTGFNPGFTGFADEYGRAVDPMTGLLYGGGEPSGTLVKQYSNLQETNKSAEPAISDKQKEIEAKAKADAQAAADAKAKQDAANAKAAEEAKKKANEADVKARTGKYQSSSAGDSDFWTKVDTILVGQKLQPTGDITRREAGGGIAPFDAPIKNSDMSSVSSAGSTNKEILKGNTQMEVVGQNGPEIVTTQKEGEIIPADKTQQVLSGEKTVEQVLPAKAKRTYYTGKTTNPHKKAEAAGFMADDYMVTIGKGAGVRNNNPGNLRPLHPKNDKDYRRFPTPEEGFIALVDDLLTKQTRKRGKVHANSTLQEVMNVFAPKADKNKPEEYAKFLASKLPGVTTKTPLKDIPIGPLAEAIVWFESNTKIERVK
jgi:hypothetical protein